MSPLIAATEVRDARRVAALRHVLALPCLRWHFDVEPIDGGIRLKATGIPVRDDGGIYALYQFVDELSVNDRPYLPDCSHLDDACRDAVLAAMGELYMRPIPAQRAGESA